MAMSQQSSNSKSPRGINDVIEGHTSSFRMWLSATFDEDERLDPAIQAKWSSSRRACAKFLRSTFFKWGMGSMIVTNMVMVVIETDRLHHEEGAPVWLSTASVIFLTMFTIELVARIYVFRASFVATRTNLLDLFVVSIDILSEVGGALVGELPSLSVLRVIRIARFVRAAQIIEMFPELHSLVQALAGTARTVFWGSIAIWLSLTVWGVIAVHFIHPLSLELSKAGVWEEQGCIRCERAYQSVLQSILTFTQQSICGDGWGQLSIPIIEAYPGTAFFFAGVTVSVNLGILNLIMAIIVDKAQETRDSNIKLVAKKKERQAAAARARFVDLCKDLDVDGSGSLMFGEIVDGYDDHQHFRDTLRAMDIDRNDLEVVFKFMDQDCSGDVNYEEFAEQLFKLKSHDSHTLLVFIKFYVTEIREKLGEQLMQLRSDLSSSIHSPSEANTSDSPNGVSPETLDVLRQTLLKMRKEVNHDLALIANRLDMPPLVRSMNSTLNKEQASNDLAPDYDVHISSKSQSLSPRRTEAVWVDPCFSKNFGTVSQGVAEAPMPMMRNSRCDVPLGAHNGQKQLRSHWRSVSNLGSPHS